MSACPRFRIEQVSWAVAAERLSAVRIEVFVREQGVPLELECDALDESCVHVLATDSDGGAIGTGRLLPDGHIGRMAVLEAWRGSGVGRAILGELLAVARARGHAAAVLNAQTHACGFYRRAGFEVTSGEFMDAGIPHVEMRLELRKH